MNAEISGIIPVMITPFKDDGSIDWRGYEALIEWYLSHGSEALFAVCQSSEMRYLSLDERVALSRFTVETVAGRVPVVSSGHISERMEDQIEELQAIAKTGPDAVILVTNRLAASSGSAQDVRSSLDAILAALPSGMPLGLYECPAPYRRLLSDEEIEFCAQSGRFVLIKDVSCDMSAIKRRVEITDGTPLRICNANAAIAYPAMKISGAGFCGVMNNFHPDLYRWIQDHGADYPGLAKEMEIFLALSAQTEPMGYPVLAKIYHKRLGTFANISSRAVTYDVHEKFWALEAVIDHIQTGADLFRMQIQGL